MAGLVDAKAFTSGEKASITHPIVDLRAARGGNRDRQLICGDAVVVIDRQKGWSFVQSQKDGYCGWITSDSHGPAEEMTHWITARLSHLYPEPRVQAEATAVLPFGSLLRVVEVVGAFARTSLGYVPLPHVSAVQHRPTDPVAVAQSFLGAPYLWGGNTALGIDCSGLVQTAFLACQLACPGDSDQQAQMAEPLAPSAPLLPGDLIFWKGHVAMVCGPDLLIHANGHSMDVCTETITGCIDRIAKAGGGPVTARLRHPGAQGVIRSAG